MNKNSAPLLSVGYLLYVIGVAVGTVLSAPDTAIGAENVITCQPNQDTSIEYGDIVNCSIEAINDSDLIRFSGSIGETIMVQTFRLGGTGDPLVDLFAPDGIRMGGGPNPFQITLQQSGPHTIMITEFTNNATVDYALTVERIAPPSLIARQTQYGRTLNDSINSIVDIDSFFFEATVGDTVSVSVSRLGGTGDPLVDLFAPDGTRIGGGLNPFQVTLQQSGPHTIMVTEFTNDATVDYALTVQCISGDCTIVPIPDVSGCINRKGTPLA
ncbi:MAG TPA: hypothetical protein VE735_03055, partial [Gammaproteobacteria bacterium]|nr:hypothetical protein [Gammaproteobacteria bacterium]